MDKVAFIALYNYLTSYCGLKNISFDLFEVIYHEPFKLQTYYQTWAIPKKNGSMRIIQAPQEPLKTIQKSLVKLFQLNSPNPDWLFGKKGKGARAGAEKHKGKKIIVQMDVEDFFPSTTDAMARVEMTHYTNGNLLITALPFCFVGNHFLQEICLRLPQGAPTSSIIADLVFYSIDLLINQYCNPRGITYTRYADDLTFSFNKYPKNFQKDIVGIIETYSTYKVNHKKSKVCYRDNDSQVITGIVVNSNNDLSIPREWKRELRATLHNQAYCNEFLNKETQGKLAYLKQINPYQYNKIMLYYHKQVQRWSSK